MIFNFNLKIKKLHNYFLSLAIFSLLLITSNLISYKIVILFQLCIFFYLLIYFKAIKLNNIFFFNLFIITIFFF